MQALAVMLQQRPVSRLLHQRVPEQVLQLRLRLHQANQAGNFERGELADNGHALPLRSTCSNTFTWNCRPITAATRRVYFSSSDNRSMRANSSPCRVSGMSTVSSSLPTTQLSPL